MTLGFKLGFITQVSDPKVCVLRNCIIFFSRKMKREAKGLIYIPGPSLLAKGQFAL